MCVGVTACGGRERWYRSPACCLPQAVTRAYDEGQACEGTRASAGS